VKYLKVTGRQLVGASLPAAVAPPPRVFLAVSVTLVRIGGYHVLICSGISDVSGDWAAPNYIVMDADQTSVEMTD
jgi:hypothetical protein